MSSKAIEIRLLNYRGSQHSLNSIQRPAHPGRIKQQSQLKKTRNTTDKEGQR